MIIKVREQDLVQDRLKIKNELEVYTNCLKELTILIKQDIPQAWRDTAEKQLEKSYESEILPNLKTTYTILNYYADYILEALKNYQKKDIFK